MAGKSRNLRGNSYFHFVRLFALPTKHPAFAGVLKFLPPCKQHFCAQPASFPTQGSCAPSMAQEGDGGFHTHLTEKTFSDCKGAVTIYLIGAGRGGYICMINGSGGKEERGGKAVSSRRADDVILNVIARQLRAENTVTPLCTYTLSSPCLAPSACCGTYVICIIMPQIPQLGGRRSRVTSLPLTVYWYSQQKAKTGYRLKPFFNLQITLSLHLWEDVNSPFFHCCCFTQQWFQQCLEQGPGKLL